MTFHISIGNSDDKLSQRDWAAFYDETQQIVHAYSTTIHGRWVSPSTDPYQNACWAFDLHRDEDLFLFRRRLARLAAKWGQDSIALNSSETEFVTPDFLGREREGALDG